MESKNSRQQIKLLFVNLGYFYKLIKMSQVISVEYPDYLANAMRLNKDDFGNEIKISALVKLFEMGKVSSGTAAKVLQISRIEFLELLSRYKVGFLFNEDLMDDLENA